MPVFKTIFLFQDTQQTAGFSEVQYITAASIQAAYNLAQPLGQIMQTIRDSSYILGYIRVSSAPVAPIAPYVRAQRAAQLFPLQQLGNAPEGNPGPMLAWNAAMVRVYDTTQTVFRNILMRGIPDEWFSNGTDKLARKRMAAFLPQYVQALTAASAVIMHLQRGPNNRVPVAIAGAFYERLVRRATGRPFATLVGRR